MPDPLGENAWDHQLQEGDDGYNHEIQLGSVTGPGHVVSSWAEETAMRYRVERVAQSSFARLVIGVCLVLVSASAHAAVLTFPLGTNSFADGMSVGTATFTGASDVSPFNTFIGSDVSGPDMSTSWMFTYPQITDPITSATILVSLYDDDSIAAGSQLQAFDLNSTVDLRSSLDALMEAKQDGSGLIAYYTVNIPSSGFAQLASGNVTVNLALQGPGHGVLGDTTFNGGGVDFAVLTITTVPEPATLGMLLLGAAAARRRRR
jgi:hypothetical protein